MISIHAQRRGWCSSGFTFVACHMSRSSKWNSWSRTDTCMRILRDGRQTCQRDKEKTVPTRLHCCDAPLIAIAKIDSWLLMFNEKGLADKDLTVVGVDVLVYTVCLWFRYIESLPSTAHFQLLLHGYHLSPIPPVIWQTSIPISLGRPLRGFWLPD